ncbi:hypothetical protein ACS0PU_009287 [Formica fusca]
MSREGKEPEIVAQMNLKYCHSTSLHLSPVDRRSSRLSIILPFVRAFARGTVEPGTVFFLPRSLLFTIVAVSFPLISLPPKVAFSCGRLDRCAQPHIRAQRPYEFAWYNDKLE